MNATNNMVLRVGSFNFDAKVKAISGASLMTANREAVGHGIFIDNKTLETAAAVSGEKLKSYVTHAHGRWHDRGEFDVAGYFSGIVVEGDKLVAKGFSFYDAYREHNTKEYAQLLEMAEKTPELFGLSVEVDGHVVFVDEKGNEYTTKPAGKEIQLRHGGMPVLRVTRMPAVAFVTDPAANDGLFSMFSAFKKWFTNDQTPSKVETPEKVQSTKHMTAEELIKSLKARLSTRPELLAKAIVRFDGTQSASDLVADVLLEEVAAYGTATAGFTQRETELTQKLKIATDEIVDLKAKLDAANKLVESTKKEAAAKMSAARQSGFGMDIDLTVPKDGIPTVTQRCALARATA